MCNKRVSAWRAATAEPGLEAAHTLADVNRHAEDKTGATQAAVEERRENPSKSAFNLNLNFFHLEPT